MAETPRMFSLKMYLPFVSLLLSYRAGQMGVVLESVRDGIKSSYRPELNVDFDNKQIVIETAFGRAAMPESEIKPFWEANDTVSLRRLFMAKIDEALCVPSSPAYRLHALSEAPVG